MIRDQKSVIEKMAPDLQTHSPKRQLYTLFDLDLPLTTIRYLTPIPPISEISTLLGIHIENLKYPNSRIYSYPSGCPTPSISSGRAIWGCLNLVVKWGPTDGVIRLA